MSNNSLEQSIEDSVTVSDGFQHMAALAQSGNLIAPEAEKQHQDRLDIRAARDVQTDEPQEVYTAQGLTPDEPTTVYEPASRQPLHQQEVRIEAPRPEHVDTTNSQELVQSQSVAQRKIVDLLNLPTRAAKKAFDFDKFSANKSKMEPTYNVIALNSGYKVSMRAISLSIKEAMVENQKNNNFYDRELQSATAIYNCIHSMNITKPTFKTWCDITAYQDLATLQYGMLARTYPRPFEFEFSCTNDNCTSDKPIKVSIIADDFVAISDEDTSNRIGEVIQECKTIADLREKNHVFESCRSVIDDSDDKIIIDIRKSFSVTNILDTVQAFSSREIQKSSAIIFFLAAIESIFVLDEETEDYVQFSEPRQIFNVMTANWFKPSWSDYIEKKVDEYAKPYQINYQIPATTCPNCNHKQAPKPINVESLLFFKMTGQM